MWFQDAKSTVLCKSSHEAGFQNEFAVCLHHLLIKAFLRQALQGHSDKLLGIWPGNVPTCLTIFQLSFCLQSKSNVTDSNSGIGSQSNTAFIKHRSLNLIPESYWYFKQKYPLNISWYSRHKTISLKKNNPKGQGRPQALCGIQTEKDVCTLMHECAKKILEWLWNNNNNNCTLLSEAYTLSIHTFDWRESATCNLIFN